MIFLGFPTSSRPVPPYPAFLSYLVCSHWGREDGELLEWYTALGKARRALPALRRGELAWTLTRGRVLSFLRTGAEGSVLAAVNAGERPEPIDLPWPARDWMTGAALEQGEQTLPPMTGWLLTPRPEGA